MSPILAIVGPEPDHASIVAATKFDDLRCLETPTPTSRWSDCAWHYSRVPASSRGVEITYEDGAFRVKFLALSSDDDYEIGLRFVEAVAGPDGTVTPADGEPFPASELRHLYGSAWQVAQQQAAAQAMVKLIRDDDTTLTVTGCARDCFIGPRVLDELIGEVPPDELPGRLMEVIRSVQHIDTEGYFPAERYHMKKNNAPDEKPFTMAVWSPGVRVMMPPVDYLCLATPTGIPLVIRGEGLEELAGYHLHWLDERQAIVEAVYEDAWPELLERAQEYKVAL